MRSLLCVMGAGLALGLTGCASARSLPPELPPLPKPAVARKPPPPAMPVAPEMALIDAGGSILPQAIPIEQTFKARLSYKLPRGERLKEVILVSLLYDVPSKGWAVAWQDSGKPKQDRSGKYTLEVTLKSPPRAGKCVVCARVYGTDFIQVPLEVK